MTIDWLKSFVSPTSDLFWFLLQSSTVILCVAFLATFALKWKSASTRHFIWLLAFLTTMLLPLSLLPIPGAGLARTYLSVKTPEKIFALIDEGTFDEISHDLLDSEPLPATPASNAFQTVGDRHRFSPAVNQNFSWLLMGTYICVTIVLLGRLASSHLRVRGLIRASRKGKLLGEDVYFCSLIELPATAGIFDAFILMPESAKRWSQDQQATALKHEMAHVQRKDTVAVLIVALTKCFYWFQPLVWFASRAMALDREVACDDRVLQSGMSKSTYAEALLKLAEIRSAMPDVVLQAFQKPIEQRIRFVLSTNVNRKRTSVALMILLPAAAIFIWGGIAVTQAQVNSVVSGPNQEQIEAIETAKTARFSGVIEDDDSNPIADAKVEVVVRRRFPVNRLKRIESFETRTDANGIYQFEIEHSEELSSCVVTVFASTDLHFRKWESYDAETLLGSESPPKLQLSRGRIVTGRVVDETGEAEIFKVTARSTYLETESGKGRVWRPFQVTLDADQVGEFRFPAPSDREIAIFATAEDLAVASTKLEKDETDVEIRLQPGVSIQGRVVDHLDRPLVGQAISLVEKKSITANNSRYRAQSSVLSDHEGRFRFPHHLGKCTVSVDIYGFSTFGGSLTDSIEVDKLACVTPVNLELAPGVNHGQIVLKEYKPVCVSGRIQFADGTNASEVLILAYVSGQIIAKTYTQSDGTYQLRMPRKTESFWIQALGAYTHDQQWQQAYAKRHPQEIAGYSSRRQNIQLENTGADICDVDWTIFPPLKSADEK